MDEYEDDLARLAASGLTRRRSSTVGLPLTPAQDRGSEESGESSASEGWGKTSYRVVVMGANKVGKTAIISQFLYDQFKPEYKATVEEMYRGQFKVGNVKLSLDIEDTSGTFAFDFPAMVDVSLTGADAVLLVFSVADQDSFEMVGVLRDLVMKCRGPDMPVVVVGNKTDLSREVDMVETESLVKCDWENGYVECSAKNNQHIQEVFKELLVQTRGLSEIFPSMSSSHKLSPVSMRRRQSLLPVVPVFNRGLRGEQGGRRKEGSRRGSIVSIMGDNCKVS